MPCEIILIIYFALLISSIAVCAILWVLDKYKKLMYASIACFLLCIFAWPIWVHKAADECLGRKADNPACKKDS